MAQLMKMNAGLVMMITLMTVSRIVMGIEVAGQLQMNIVESVLGGQPNLKHAD